MDARDGQVRINRAWAYQKLGKYEPAQADFDAVVRADPANAEAHAGLGYVEACLKSDDSANEEAARALMFGANDYLILHDVACIYAQISETEPARRSEYQDLAIALLGRAVETWRNGKSGPDEIQAIEHEPTFSDSLRVRPGFRALLSNASSKADF